MRINGFRFSTLVSVILIGSIGNSAEIISCPKGSEFKEESYESDDWGKKITVVEQHCESAPNVYEGKYTKTRGGKLVKEENYLAGKQHGKQWELGDHDRTSTSWYYKGDESTEAEFKRLDARDRCEDGDSNACGVVASSGSHAEKSATFEKLCAAGNTDACGRVKQLQDHEKQVAAKEAERDRAAKLIEQKSGSKECEAAKTARLYCKNLAGIKLAEANITRENKVGQQSGYVNKAVLRNNGSAKIQMEEAADKNSNLYKKLSGQSIGPSFCQIVQYDGTDRIGYGPSDPARRKISDLVTKSCGIDEED